MKITYSFEVPYFIRTNSTNRFSISHKDFQSVLEIQNPEGFAYPPLLTAQKSEVRGLIFSHPDENYELNLLSKRSRINITVNIKEKTLDSFSEMPMSIFSWKEKKIEHSKISRILGDLFNKVIETFDRFLEVYTFTSKEIYNGSHIETIYERSFQFGVKIFIDNEYISQFFFIPNTSLIPLSSNSLQSITKFLRKDIPIDVVSNLLFQGFVNYSRKNYTFSLLTIAQALEIFINKYLIGSPNFELDERGTKYIFKGSKKEEPVGTIRKYSDVLNDYKKNSLSTHSTKLWDDLDVIVGLRNSIIHENLSNYRESKQHRDLRGSGLKRIEHEVDLRKEFIGLLTSAYKIIQWVENL